MSEQDPCRIQLQGPLHNHPRVDGGPVDGALEQLLEGDDPMAIIDVDTGEHLELALAHLQAQVGARGLRAGQGPAPAVTLREHLERQVEQGVDLLRV